MKKRSSRRRKKFSLAAFVARKIEEHSRLARDSSRIAIVMALLVLAFMLANAFYKTWVDLRPVTQTQRR